MPEPEEIILDDVLCFISSARNSISSNQITANAVAFFKSDLILKSKDRICSLAGYRNITRKQCSSHPNPSTADLEDILSMFEKIVSSAGSALPKFVCSGYQAIPPISASEAWTSVICSVRDEITALREQVVELRKATEKDMKALDNVGSIFQDVAEIKQMLHEIPNKIADPSTTSQSLPEVPSRSQNPASQVNDASMAHNTTYASVLTQDSPPNADLINPVEAPAGQPRSDNDGFTTVNRSRRVSNRQNSNNGGNNRRHGPRRNNTDNRSTSQLRRGDVINAQPQSRRRGNISGTGAAVAGLSAGPRVLDVFVGGCSLESTELSISDYATNKGVHFIKCASLPSRSEWFKCFKISVIPANRDKLLEANFWPEGIVVGKYFRPRSANN